MFCGQSLILKLIKIHCTYLCTVNLDVIRQQLAAQLSVFDFKMKYKLDHFKAF